VASGQNLLTVARQPAHVVLLILAVLALPLWMRAARARLLGQSIAAVIATSLLLEGNGLSAVSLAIAVAVSLVFALVGGWAIEGVAFAALPEICIPHGPDASGRPIGAPRRGPYFAFVATRGNRPPPVLLGLSRLLNP